MDQNCRKLHQLNSAGPTSDVECDLLTRDLQTIWQFARENGTSSIMSFWLVKTDVPQ